MYILSFCFSFSFDYSMDRIDDVSSLILCKIDIYTLITSIRLTSKRWNILVDHSVVIRKHLVDEIRTRFPTFHMTEDYDIKKMYPYIIIWRSYREQLEKDDIRIWGPSTRVTPVDRLRNGADGPITLFEADIIDYVIYQVNTPVYIDTEAWYSVKLLLLCAMLMCRVIPRYRVLFASRACDLSRVWILIGRYCEPDIIINSDSVIFNNGSTLTVITTAMFGCDDEPTEKWRIQLEVIASNRIYLDNIRLFRKFILDHHLLGYEDKIVAIDGDIRQRNVEKIDVKPGFELGFMEDIRQESWRKVRVYTVHTFYVCTEKGKVLQRLMERATGVWFRTDF